MECRLWRTFGVWTRAVNKRTRTGAAPSASDAYQAAKITDFLMCTDSAARHIIEKLCQDDLEYIYHESFCLVAALKATQVYDSTALLRRTSELGNKALREGRERFKRAAQEWILRALGGGAGQAHKVANKANALPELRLIFKKDDRTGLRVCHGSIPCGYAPRSPVGSRVGKQRPAQVRRGVKSTRRNETCPPR